MDRCWADLRESLAGYVLKELPEADLEKTVRTLGAACSGVLLLIEPGTPQGSEIIQRARDLLIQNGAHIIAPCPQAEACPWRGAAERWCHFSVRIDRSRLHRQANDAGLSYADKSFSFISAGCNARARPDSRIIGHPAGARVCGCRSAIPKGGFRHSTYPKVTCGIKPCAALAGVMDFRQAAIMALPPLVSREV